MAVSFAIPTPEAQPEAKADPKPGYVAAYSSPLVAAAPVAYSAAYSAPVAYAAPSLAYSAYSAYPAYSAYASPYVAVY